MAVDEALLRSCASGSSGPVLRCYGWRPHALSIGAHQDAGRAADLGWLGANGLDLVRRPTGGRAVLHARELTYAVAAPHDTCPGGITEVYRLVAQGLLRGIANLGIHADLVRGRPRRLPDEGLHPCFSSPARYEVVWRGKKLIGSAQRQTDGGFLQHGSLPFESDEESVRLATGNARIAGGWMAGLEEAAGRPLEFGEVARALREGFEGIFGDHPADTGLDPAEEERAARLVEDKYANPAWTLRRTAGPVPALR